MKREIVICDICGNEIVGDDRHAIDAKVRHTTAMNKRGGFARVDMCPKCYAKLVEMCKAGCCTSFSEGSAK